MQQVDYQTVTYGNIDVCYMDELDGGGPRFGQVLVEQVIERIPMAGHVFEWCAGPGFIGFSLLARGFCERLTLADVNPQAVEAARQTVDRNGLGDRVAVYQSDNLRQIPKEERWNLVVGNPPHFPQALPRHVANGFVLRSVDEGFRLHREFYREIGRFLEPEGTIMVVESTVAGDHRALLQRMLDDNALELVEPIWQIDRARSYYVWSRIKR